MEYKYMYSSSKGEKSSFGDLGHELGTVPDEIW